MNTTKNDMRLLIDLPSNVIKKLAEMAKKNSRSRKNYIEVTLINHVTNSQSKSTK